jgi:uncharacterized 2Fe-2S/4Fe-4S cluster protein (DUF4445 family)
MTKIVFTPSVKTVEVPRGTQLLEAARQAGVEMDTPCGGEGSCGRCVVRVDSGDIDTDSLGILPKEAVDEGYVLACRTVVLDSPLTVEVPEPVGRTGGKFIEDEDADWLVRDDLVSKRLEIDPLTRRMFLHVPAPQLEDGLSDADRLTRSIQKEIGKRRLEYSLSVIRSLADALREDNGRVTVTLTRTFGCDRVIGIKSGDQSTRSFGVAIDVGTTTIAVQVVSLTTAKAVATRIDYNSQISCGLDVISRIHYAHNPVRREELRVRVLGTINNLIRKATQTHGVTPDEISAAAIAGNTTMIHLLLGLNPEYIRLEPYTPTLHEACSFTAKEIGIHIHPESTVFLCPSVGSYVGGDITAGLLCTGFAEDTESIHLFMDIGTNGELVVGNCDFLVTCACSAGPAFEGGGIEQGMRAATGAIERVEINPETGVAKYWTIGDAKPLGICGSGMISLLANLYRTGWVDQAGRLSRSRRSPAIQFDGRRGQYRVVSAEDTGTNSAITISELDIENIMRAKAAVYSAIGLLLNHAGIGIDKIAEIYIAGGFGRFLDLEEAITIGLLPDISRSKFRYIGNSSLSGAYKVLISKGYRDRVFELSRRMTYIELNTNPSYMDQYTSALFLPHTDMTLFPSVQTALANQAR